MHALRVDVPVEADIHHIHAFGSVTYSYTPVSKRKKLSVNCCIGFLIGCRDDALGCHVYFPTVHKRGILSDIKINEQMKYRDCYQMGLKMKVYKWLQTFDEFVVQGELDNHVDEDNEEDDFSSQQAECDNESVKSDQPSNVIMKETEFDGISSGGSLMWNAIVRNSTPFDLDAVGAASDEPPLDYESDIAFKEMQEGGSVA
ncbi:Copia type Polyprotein [Phytophthora cinnamomi]|uniref:Copia type Polyprotein n=1 Tax=Phytophthora cinnamomi TaxID=4785 RepID=UPI0035597FA8|nr:Copia type Polyprotein [Phytophthora cinnamomi]